MEKYRKIPLYFQIHTSSIPDVITLKMVIFTLSQVIVSIAIFQVRDVFSMENLKIINETGYIITASTVVKDIKNIFVQASRTVSRLDNVILYKGKPVFRQRVEFTMKDLKFQGYFYHYIIGESRRRPDLHKNLAEGRKATEAIYVSMKVGK